MFAAFGAAFAIHALAVGIAALKDEVPEADLSQIPEAVVEMSLEQEPAPPEPTPPTGEPPIQPPASELPPGPPSSATVGSQVAFIRSLAAGGRAVTNFSGSDSSSGGSNAGKSGPPPQRAPQSPPPRMPWSSTVFGLGGTGGVFGGSGVGGGVGGAAIGLLAALCLFAFAQLLGSRLSTQTTPLRAASPAFQLTRPG